jgi:hypothetical protein
MHNGLASAAHQYHRRQRLIMRPALENWHDGDWIDMVEEMFTLTTAGAGNAPDPGASVRRIGDTTHRQFILS